MCTTSTRTVIALSKKFLGAAVCPVRARPPTAYDAPVRFRVVLAFFLGLLSLALALATWKAFQVRSQLEEARDDAQAVRTALASGDLQRARGSLPRLAEQLDAAAGRTGGPSWWVAERVPLLGGNFRAVRRAALAADLLGDAALPAAADALDVVGREQLLRNGVVDLGAVRDLRLQLRRAASASTRASALLRDRQALLLPPVSRGVARSRAEVAAVDGLLRSSLQAAEVAPGMLGEDRPRRFFLAVQNPAEARATGGLVGAFAIMRTDRGRVVLERTGTDNELPVLARPVPSSPLAADTWMRRGSRRAWYAANFTPHFPDAARNLAGLWEAKTGQRMDGVIALDPLVMSELLRVAGPIRLQDGLVLRSDNIVDFVGRDEYVRYPDVPTRKARLRDLAGLIFDKVVTSGDSVGMVRAFARAGQSGHLFIWSATSAEQKVLGNRLVGGALPGTNRPYLQVLTQNLGGNKLDFYLRRSVSVEAAGGGWYDVSVTLVNGAPAGLPTFMTVRADRPQFPVDYAQARVNLAVYGAPGSEFRRFRVDERATVVRQDRDHLHRLATLTLELPRNSPTTVTFQVRQPPGKLLYRQQPLVVPDRLQIKVPHSVVGR